MENDKSDIFVAQIMNQDFNTNLTCELGIHRMKRRFGTVDCRPAMKQIGGFRLRADPTVPPEYRHVEAASLQAPTDPVLPAVPSPSQRPVQAPKPPIAQPTVSYQVEDEPDESCILESFHTFEH
jgi:hypothetical protein